MLDSRFKHKVTCSAHWSETEPWLIEHVGEWNERWYRIHDDITAMVVNVGDIHREYWFTREQDAFLFTLRWA